MAKSEGEQIYALKKYARHHGSREVLAMIAGNRRFALDCGITSPRAREAAARLRAVVRYQDVLTERDDGLHGPAAIENGRLTSI